ncbi:MAG: DUF11 domain-containing protein, partial [Anaerolineales bacterium]|nr:DUF11 domain-containing protein [Anaerolineales bacterium]
MYNLERFGKLSFSLGLAAALIVLSFFLLLGAGNVNAQDTDLIITGVIDGPLTGGIPKAIELYVLNDVADLSVYGVGSANNGEGSDGEEYTFPADSATAGDYIYVATESTAFNSFFGFSPNYTDTVAPSINGDDAIELFKNSVVVDVFGDINVDGSGQAWDYLDGWAYRVDETGPDGSTFVVDNWSFSGINALDGETTNDSADTPFPLGTYSPGEGALALLMTKSVEPELDVPYHGEVTCTIVVKNSGAVDEIGVMVTDTLPAGTTFARWTPDIQPPFSIFVLDELLWGGNILAGESITFSFVISHTGEYGDAITNTAVFSGSTTTGDAEATFTVESAGEPRLIINEFAPKDS